MKNLSVDKKRILFVEDDQESVELVSHQLTEYKLSIARNFTDGLRQAQKRYFDLYLLNNLLPDGTGIELCHCIRAFDPFTPVIFYSGLTDLCHMQEAIDAGAQAYLTKPVNSEELIRSITHALSSSNESAFEARRAEIAAILEELATRYSESAGRAEDSNNKYLRSKAKMLRLTAEKAFLCAGGTRGEFARLWCSGFIVVV